MTKLEQAERAISIARGSQPRTYAQIMSGAIRAARSPQVLKQLRGAVAADRREALFMNWDTAAPIARYDL